MKSKNQIVVLITGLLLMFIISNCKKQESPSPIGGNQPNNNPTIPPNSYNPPAITFSAPVIGFVEDVNGNPVAGAVVTTGSKTATTDVNGAFEIAAAPFTGDFCYIKATKNGYFTGSTTIHGQSGHKFSTTLTMLSYGAATTFKATDAKVITIGNGASVNFPANAIKTLDGKPYTGNVNVVTAHIDPAAVNFRRLIPGGDLRAYSAANQNVQLYSYGMLNVELRDDAGNYLQLANGQKATLTMPVPASMQGKAPATIPLWYFDENKGVWIEEGGATLSNGIYTGTVTHFTSWNCDWPGDRATIKGKVKDCDGEVVAGLKVFTDQMEADIDEEGNWKRWIPAGIDVEISIMVPSTKEIVKITSVNLKKDEVKNTGDLVSTCLAKVKGNVTDCDNKPFNGYVIIKTPTVTYKNSITDGKLKMTVAGNGEPAEIFFHSPAAGQLSKITATLPTGKTTLDLGNIKACPQTNVPTFFSFDYNDGSTTKSVSFSNLTQSKGVFKASGNRMEFDFQNQSPQQGSAYFQIINPKVGNFPGNQNLINVQLYSTSSYKSFFANDNTTYQISYNVQKYGAVAGEVSGTFSGTMFMSDSTSSGGGSKIVTVTNGKFSCVRLPDE